MTSLATQTVTPKTIYRKYISLVHDMVSLEEGQVLEIPCDEDNPRSSYNMRARVYMVLRSLEVYKEFEQFSHLRSVLSLTLRNDAVEVRKGDVGSITTSTKADFMPQSEKHHLEMGTRFFHEFINTDNDKRGYEPGSLKFMVVDLPYHISHEDIIPLLRKAKEYCLKKDRNDIHYWQFQDEEQLWTFEPGEEIDMSEKGIPPLFLTSRNHTTIFVVKLV